MPNILTSAYKSGDLTIKLTALLFVTTFIHHLWGEAIFGGGVRGEIALVFAAVFLLTIGVYLISKKVEWVKHPYWLLVIGFWIVLVGLVEGAFNHVFKVATWIAGVSETTIASFYGSEYEPVSDFFFEVTGILTAVIACIMIGVLAKQVLARR